MVVTGVAVKPRRTTPAHVVAEAILLSLVVGVRAIVLINLEDGASIRGEALRSTLW